MATVIDELVVVLGLDPSKLKQGRKDAAEELLKFKRDSERNSKEVVKHTGDMTDAFGMLQKKLLGVAALFMGGMGMKEWMDYMVRANSELGYLSQRLDTSAQGLAAWEYAGGRVGAKAGEISGSIASMRSALAAGQLHGVSSLQKYFMAMGIQPYQQGPNGLVMRSPTSVLTDMSKWAQGQNPLIASQMFSEMGMSPGMINLLMKGPDVLARYLKEAKDAAPTPKQIEDFQRLQSAMSRTSTEAMKLGRLLADAVAGPLTKFFDATTKWLRDIQQTDPAKIQKQADKLHGDLRDRFGNPSDHGLGGLERWLNPGAGGLSTRKFEERMGPWGKKSDGGAAPASGVAQSSRTATAKQAMMEQLRKEGVPEGNLDAAASMLAGQAIAESNLNPNAVHDHGTGYGIYGARLGRRDRMLQWLAANGYAKNSLEGQSKYMAHEAMTAYPSARRVLMSANKSNMSGGTFVLTRDFESPAVNNSGARYNAAMRAFETPLAKGEDWGKGSAPVPFITPHPGLVALQGQGNVSHNNTTSSTHIQSLTVNSQTDSPWSHATDIKAALERNELVNQNTYGAN